MRVMIERIKAEIKKAVRFTAWTTGLTVAFLALSFATGFVQVPERIVHVPVEVERPQPKLEDLIQEIAPKYGINPIVIEAMVQRESGGKKNAIRFEPGQMGRAQRISKDPQQQRMLASSHGPLQIMGWWAPEFGIEWSDLYDLRTNVEVSCAILKKGEERHSTKPKLQRLRGALAAYNGSTEYADAVMRTIGERLIEERL